MRIVIQRVSRAILSIDGRQHSAIGKGLLGKTVGITRLRGHWRTYRNTPLMPTYHPAYLLRNQALSEKRRVWEDMLLVMEKSGSWDEIKGAWFFPGVPLGLLLCGIMELLLRLFHALLSSPREANEEWGKPLADGMFYAVLLSIALIGFLAVAELGAFAMAPNPR